MRNKVFKLKDYQFLFEIQLSEGAEWTETVYQKIKKILILQILRKNGLSTCLLLNVTYAIA